MTKIRREAKLMNSVLEALLNSKGETEFPCLINEIKYPFNIPNDKKKHAVSDVGEYLVESKCITRKKGVWALTSKGKQLILPLSNDEIEKIMKPGHVKWYGKTYKFPKDLEL